MRKAIGARVQEVCQACETESKFGEISFFMGLSGNTSLSFKYIQKAVEFGLIPKTGQRRAARYIAKPDWKKRIEENNAKPQIKEFPGYVLPNQTRPPLTIGRVNSVFQLGAML